MQRKKQVAVGLEPGVSGERGAGHELREDYKSGTWADGCDVVVGEHEADVGLIATCATPKDAKAVAHAIGWLRRHLFTEAEVREAMEWVRDASFDSEHPDFAHIIGHIRKARKR